LGCQTPVIGGYFLLEMVEFPPLTDFTGRIFAYKSSSLRIATMGDEYPATRREGELYRGRFFSTLTSDDARRRIGEQQT
jgi:hypothetical protein